MENYMKRLLVFSIVKPKGYQCVIIVVLFFFKWMTYVIAHCFQTTWPTVAAFFLASSASTINVIACVSRTLQLLYGLGALEFLVLNGNISIHGDTRSAVRLNKE